ncbi:MAG: hypothetical protein Q7S89_03705 [bacterium]|nr:hypothetical protein [bacterium]
MLTQRQQTILSSLINLYTKYAEPIGSNAVLRDADLDVSGATARSEMSYLEEEGYLTHPYTSAGRIPTVKGYRYFRDHLMPDTAPTEAERDVVREMREQEHDVANRAIAKAIASRAQEAVFVAIESQDVYYTGLSFLFAKPEFGEQELVVNISELLDHLNDAIVEMSGSVSQDVCIWIGDEHSFGDRCSLVVARSGADGCMYGILGLERMDYLTCARLVRSACEIV